MLFVFCFFFSSIYKTVAATKSISNLSNSYLISEAVYFHRLTAMLLLSPSEDRNSCDHLQIFFIPLTEFPTLSKNTREKRIKKLASSMLQLLKKLTKLTERPFEVGGRLRRFVLRSLWLNPDNSVQVSGQGHRATAFLFSFIQISATQWKQKWCGCCCWEETLRWHPCRDKLYSGDTPVAAASERSSSL